MSADLDLDKITKQLSQTTVNPGVSFQGQALVLDSENDCLEVVKAIEECKDLHFLNLEGNTLGVEACKAIAKALETKSEFKCAIWKDIFTGRSKSEIPHALKYLSNGLMSAGAMLSELDMSDNAFGPVGFEGLAALLSSRVCYQLQTLKLNNNGLGITGGKLLAKALLTCYDDSLKAGQPLQLKVFIAGRNRLENDGATALANVFKTLGSLEEIVMPQNGIYYRGISELSKAFTYNKNLQILNLNDNTLNVKGATSLSESLKFLQKLKVLNLGDCLLHTKGAVVISNVLKDGHLNLEEINLSCNEINSKGCLEIVQVLKNKTNLKQLVLDGNYFKEAGKSEIRKVLESVGKLNILSMISEDDDDDNDEDDVEEEEEDDDDDDDTEEEDEESDNSTQEYLENVVLKTSTPGVVQTYVDIEQFINKPTPDNYLNLENGVLEKYLDNIKKTEKNEFVDAFVPVLMKLSSLSNCKNDSVKTPVLQTSLDLYKVLFTWAEENDSLTSVNNSLLVNLGLLKCEDKKFKVEWDIAGCLVVYNQAVDKGIIPSSTKDTVDCFLSRRVNPNTSQDIIII